MKLKSALKKIEKRLGYVLAGTPASKGHDKNKLVHWDGRQVFFQYENYVVTFAVCNTDRTIGGEHRYEFEKLTDKQKAQDLLLRGNNDISLIHKRRENDHTDIMTDYFAGSFYDNLTQILDGFVPPPSKYQLGDLVQFKDNKRMARYGLAGQIGNVVKVHGKIYDVLVLTRPSFEDGSKNIQTYISQRDLEVPRC